MNRLVVEQLCVVTLVAVLAGAGGRVRRAEPAGMEEAIVAGDWARVKQLAEQWAGEFGPDPVAQIARAAREAYEAEKRGDQAAAKRAWDAVREMAAKTPSMPDEWLIATFLRMEACWELGEVLEGSRQADALQRVLDTARERFQAVAKWVEDLSRRHGDSPYARRLAGVAWGLLDDYDRAIADYNKAIELKPDFAEAYNGRGVAHAAKGDYDRAIADYSKAIELRPDYAGAYLNHGVVYHHKGDYDRAIADFDKAIELKPDFAEAYNNRGSAYRARGDYDRATADYNTAIELRPDYADAYSNRGVAYRCKGDYDRAIADFNKAIALNPDHAEAYNNRGLAYRDKGDYERAIADHSKAIELKPDNAEAYYGRAMACYEKRDYERAIADFNKVIELKPDFADAYNNRGNAYLNKGDYKRAMNDYNKAIELGGVAALFNKAVVCQLARREEHQREAVEALRKFIELAPTHGLGQLVPRARQMLQELQGQ